MYKLFSVTVPGFLKLTYAKILFLNKLEYLLNYLLILIKSTDDT